MQSVDQEEMLRQVRSEAKPDDLWVFDCDGTLVEGDVGTVGAWGILRSGMADPTRLPPEWSFEIMKNQSYQDFYDVRLELAERLGYTVVFNWETWLLGGLPRDQAAKITGQAIDGAFADGDLALLHPIADLARERASKAWIVSGSPVVSVMNVARRLAIPASQVIATELNEVDGILQPEFNEHGIVWAEKKRELLEAKGIVPYFVAGDSTGDWDMFMLSKRWVWCLVRIAERKAGYRLESRLEGHFAPQGITLPRTPGLYRVDESLPSGLRTWIIEIKDKPPHA